MENIENARLLKQIANESGTKIGGTLNSVALATTGVGQHLCQAVRVQLQYPVRSVEQAMIRKNPSEDLPQIAESACKALQNEF